MSTPHKIRRQRFRLVVTAIWFMAMGVAFGLLFVAVVVFGGR